MTSEQVLQSDSCSHSVHRKNVIVDVLFREKKTTGGSNVENISQVVSALGGLPASVNFSVEAFTSFENFKNKYFSTIFFFHYLIKLMYS